MQVYATKQRADETMFTAIVFAHAHRIGQAGYDALLFAWPGVCTILPTVHNCPHQLLAASTFSHRMWLTKFTHVRMLGRAWRN